MTIENLITALGGAGFASAVAWFLLRKMWTLLESRDAIVSDHLARNTAAIEHLQAAMTELTVVLRVMKDRDDRRK